MPGKSAGTRSPAPSGDGVLARPALVMAVVFLGHQIGLHQHADIGRIELPVDDGAVADEAAESKIALHQRRQLADRHGRIEGLARQTVESVSYTHLRAHETGRNLVCRLLLE